MDFIRTVLAGWYRLVQNAEPPPTCSAGAPKRVELKDHASALASLVFCFAVVFAFVAVGWLLVWRVALRHIKFFREVLGINKDKEKKAAARKQAAEEIERLRRSVGRLSSAAPTAPNAAAGAGSAACVAPR